VVLRGLPGPGRSAFRPVILSHLAPRTSHLAPRTSHLAPRAWLAFGFAGSASPSLSTLGHLAGRPWCPPSLLRQSSAFDKERPLTRPLYSSGLRPLHLCGTRLEGGHQGLSRRYGGVGRRAVARCRHRLWRLPEPRGDAEAIAGTRLPNTFPVPLPACLPTTPPRALARPTRASGSGRVFGAHPRGEFRTSERPQAT
jgi:hypothetical protein